MTPDDKNFILHFVLFWLYMLLIVSEWIFGWPTDNQLGYIGIGWIVLMIVTSLYAWHLEARDS